LRQAVVIHGPVQIRIKPGQSLRTMSFSENRIQFAIEIKLSDNITRFIVKRADSLPTGDNRSHKQEKSGQPALRPSNTAQIELWLVHLAIARSAHLARSGGAEPKRARGYFLPKAGEKVRGKPSK
jgi:hypothetical protein